MDSYGKFMELAMKPKETGAYLRQSVFYFKDMVEDLPAQLEKMSELCHLPGFRHDSKLIEETGKSSYGSLSPLRWHIWCRKEPKERQRERQEKKKRLSLSRVRSVLLTHFFFFNAHKTLFEQRSFHILPFNNFNEPVIFTRCCASPQ